MYNVTLMFIERVSIGWFVFPWSFSIGYHWHRKAGITGKKSSKQYVRGSVSRQPRGLWKLFNFLPAVKRYRRLILIKQTQWCSYQGAKQILRVQIFCTPDTCIPFCKSSTLVRQFDPVNQIDTYHATFFAQNNSYVKR